MTGDNMPVLDLRPAPCNGVHMTIPQMNFRGTTRIALICLLSLLVATLSGCDEGKITKKRVKKAISASKKIAAELGTAQELSMQLAGSGTISAAEQQRLKTLLVDASAQIDVFIVRGQEILEVPEFDTQANLVGVAKLRDSTLNTLISIRDKGIMPLNYTAQKQLIPVYSRISANARKLATALGCTKFFGNCIICQPGDVIHCP